MKTFAVTILDDAPRGVLRALAQLPGIDLRPQRAGHHTQLAFLILGPGDVLSSAKGARLSAAAQRRVRDAGATALVYAARLSATVRAELRDAGICYVDGAGHAAITAPGVFVLIDEPRREIRAAPRGSLGYVGLRAVQMLVDHHPVIWSTTELAERAGVSLGQAHKVLAELDRVGLTRAVAADGGRGREVIDRAEVLDWLAAHRLVTHPRDVALLGYIPARDPAGIAKHLAGAAGVPAAITGMAAASHYGHPVATSIPVTTIRVATPGEGDIGDAARELGIEVVQRAANVRVIRDTGLVGTYDRRFAKGGAPLAPPSRAYLDMLNEARGEDAAAMFRLTAVKLAT